MSAFEALQTYLQGKLGVPGADVAVGDATGLYPPYVMLWGFPPTKRLATIGGDTARDVTVYVTSVAGTYHGVYVLCAAVEAALNPAEANIIRLPGGQLTITGPQRQQPIQPDRTHTLEGTNQHPFFAVQSYRVIHEKDIQP